MQNDFEFKRRVLVVTVPKAVAFFLLRKYALPTTTGHRSGGSW